MVYDRLQRDMGKKQFYGEALDARREERCMRAPMEDAPNVNLRRAELELIRAELYERLSAWTMSAHPRVTDNVRPRWDLRASLDARGYSMRVGQ
jgi:hypothetical protein